MAQEQQTQEYRGPGYISSAVGRGAVAGTVTGTVIAGASAVAEKVDSLNKYALVSEEKGFFKRSFDAFADGFKNFKPKEGLEAGKDFSKKNRYAAIGVAAVAAIAAIGGLVKVGRAKADQQLANGMAYDAEREAQNLRRENAALTDQTKVMAEEMEQIADVVTKNAKSHVEKAAAHKHEHHSHAEAVGQKHESHAEAAEASKAEAADASLAV